MNQRALLGLCLATSSWAQSHSESSANRRPDIVEQIKIFLGSSIERMCPKKPLKEDPAPVSENEEQRNAAWLWGLNVEKALKRVPKLGPLLKDYEEILAPDAYKQLEDSKEISEANLGIIRYLDGLLDKDPSLRDQATRFYDSIQAQPLQRPGELYRRALSYTQNNPRQALRLIALCGHDNVSRSPHFRAGPFTRGRAVDAHWKTYLQQIDENIATVRKDPTAQKGLPTLLAERKRVETALRTHLELNDDPKIDPCPKPENLFFAAGALAPEADIPQALKARTREFSDDNPDAAEHEREKNYHVLAAAFVACEMISRGHPPSDIIHLQKVLAWSYRTATYSQYVCADSDEAELMRRWAVGGQRLHVGNSTFDIPQSNFSIAIPAWLDKNPEWNALQRPKGWTESRYDDAKFKFQKNMIDWDWTIAQHEAGARFGAKVCARQKQ